MNFLESWVNTPLANAVGWALFHSLWQGAFIAAALAVLLRFIRSSNVRYWTACLALAAIVSAFAATLIYFLPASGRSLAVTQAPLFPVWRVVAELSAGNGEAPLAIAIPWACAALADWRRVVLLAPDGGMDLGESFTPPRRMLPSRTLAEPVRPVSRRATCVEASPSARILSGRSADGDRPFSAGRAHTGWDARRIAGRSGRGHSAA